MGDLGVTLGHLGVTWDPHSLLWGAAGCPWGSIWPDLDVFLTFWLQKFSQHSEKSDFLCILEGFLEILLVLLLRLLLKISKKLWGNLFGKSRIFFQNAPGILGETLGVFGEILVKVS